MSKELSPKLKAQLETLAAMPDEAIDTSDIPEITDWSGAVVGKFYRPLKQAVTIRLDADVVAWFKAKGGKYQTEVNKVLRSHMVEERKKKNTAA